MSQFNTYLDSVGVGEDGAYMYPDTFHDDLRGAYDSDFQGAAANIALLQQQVADLEAKNVELAAANWNLLQSVPATGTVAETPAEEEPGEETEDDDPDTDDFFKAKE